MKKHQAIVSVGSNIDPQENIYRAVTLIRSQQVLVAESTMIQTKPVGMVDQPDFINGALLIETDLVYDEFNKYLKEVESQLQRRKNSESFGPRTIDLDIVVWDCKIVHNDFNRYEHTRVPVSELIDRFGLAVEELDSDV